MKSLGISLKFYIVLVLKFFYKEPKIIEGANTEFCLPVCPMQSATAMQACLIGLIGWPAGGAGVCRSVSHLGINSLWAGVAVVGP